jgi:hypothetical protein
MIFYLFILIGDILGVLKYFMILRFVEGPEEGELQAGIGFVLDFVVKLAQIVPVLFYA